MSLQTENASTGGMPVVFDRTLGNLHGLPGVTQTKAAIVRAVEPLLGNAQTWILQTVRQKDQAEPSADENGAKPGPPPRFTLFLEYVGAEGSLRLVLPASVTETIARQRDALTDKARDAGAKRAAATRKARGIEPAFLRKKGRKK